jgi:hypothetical protein
VFFTSKKYHQIPYNRNPVNLIESLPTSHNTENKNWNKKRQQWGCSGKQRRAAMVHFAKEVQSHGWIQKNRWMNELLNITTINRNNGKNDDDNNNRQNQSNGRSNPKTSPKNQKALTINHFISTQHSRRRRKL